MSNCIVFDVETVPDTRLTNDPTFCEAFRGRVKIPANYKSDDAMDRYRDGELEKWRVKAGTHFWSARVVAIGWSWLNSKTTHIACSYKREKRVLGDFVRALHRATGEVQGSPVLGGFYIRSFDIPLITMRCGIHGIELPHWWPLAGEWRTSQADLVDLFPGYEKLDNIAAAHRLPPKLGNGADVVNMSRDECIRYLRRDVRIERSLLRIYQNRFPALRRRSA